ncbi:MAG: hypothetical protein M3209_14080 [Acidobacteriota bacterium]|nr:hypothetical protein [Acidobacteriota bacterium]
MNVEISDEKNKTILEKYEELVKAAEKQYPNLMTELESFNSNKVELQSYKDFLDAFQQTPLAISTNRTT